MIKEIFTQSTGMYRRAWVIVGTSSLSAARSRGAPTCSKCLRGAVRICVHNRRRSLYMAPCARLFRRNSELKRATGSSAHSPAKLHSRAAVEPFFFTTELITANKAALHEPLQVPASMLSNIIFFECLKKKASIFVPNERSDEERMQLFPWG